MQYVVKLQFRTLFIFLENVQLLSTPIQFNSIIKSKTTQGTWGFTHPITNIQLYCAKNSLILQFLYIFQIRDQKRNTSS